MAVVSRFGAIFRVWHPMSRVGRGRQYVSDLIFLDGAPTIVIEWAPGPAGDVPSSIVDLDPQHLHRLKSLDASGASYLYESVVARPRRFD